MSESPIEQLLGAIDKLDIEAIMGLFSPQAELLVVDGRRGHGLEAIGKLLMEFVSELRSTHHRLTAQWHPEDAWIAEVEADYELRDYTQLKGLPRVFVVRSGDDGIADLRVYGAHERPLSACPSGEEGMYVGGRWVPPL